jgi:3-hydroxyacyl-[acyl-carrier-protein] dehydratase
MNNKFLEGNFYSVTKTESFNEERNHFTVSVALNPSHPVYKGHFPEMPVAPGVAVVGMIQEILEEQLQKRLFMNEASDIKFMKLILPDDQGEFMITYTLIFDDEKKITANVIIKSGEQIFLKVRCKYTVVTILS